MESDRIKTVVYNIFHLRSSRPVERSKVRGLFLKGVVFRFFIFFLVGLIVGFTPIPIVDQSKTICPDMRLFLFMSL
ncbi:hypothetical protein KSP40_PGU002993 [Platanthera guangdongensis]|uniref:Uncharacterized protein n=1 Tax=Platanthera guangdongensis TaxID=2320717 RepID=A0ABR2MSY9_9ASPA